MFGTTINIVCGSALIVAAALWWAGLLEVGEEAPARSEPEPTGAPSWLVTAFLAAWGAAAVFIVVMLVLRFRQARRFRRGEIDGEQPH